MKILILLLYSNVVYSFYVGSWVRGSSLGIPVWKMNAKRFKEAHACALAR